MVHWNFVHQEAEQSVGRGRCFPGENAKWTREWQDGRDQDPVWCGRHKHQREQQEQSTQEGRNGTGEFWYDAFAVRFGFCCIIFARTHPPLCLYIAFCLFYSIMMKRSEMVLHREINCVPWRVRGRPDRPQVHYRKFPDNLQFSSCIMPTCCSSVHEQCLSFSVPWIISHTQYIYIRISKWAGSYLVGYFLFCYNYDLLWAFSFPPCIFRVVSCPFVSGCVSMAKLLGLRCLHTMAIHLIYPYIYNLRNQAVFLSILLICNM